MSYLEVSLPKASATRFLIGCHVSGEEDETR